MSRKLVKNLVLLVAVVLFEMYVMNRIGYDFNYLFHFAWMMPLAFIIALVVNTLGISGAALFIPFFILVFPHLSGVTLSTSDTIKIGLVTESFGLSSSALAFLMFGVVDTKIARQSILVAVPFIILGALLEEHIPSAALYTMIATLLLVSASLIFFKDKLQSIQQKSEKKRVNLITNRGLVRKKTSLDGRSYQYCLTKDGFIKRAVGFGLGGFFQGSSGFGIGEIGIISMLLSKIPTRIAIGTSHIIVASTAILASLIHFSTGSSGDFAQFFWNIPFMTVPAVVLAGQLAPHITAKLKTKQLNMIIVLLFFVISVALISLVLPL